MAFSLRQFVSVQHGVPWKLRLLLRRVFSWRFRRTLTRGRANLNFPDTMDATYASLDDAFTSMENLYENLLPLLPSQGRLLDAGCGIGVLLRWIHQRYPDLDLCGVDFSPVGVERTCGYGFDAKLAILPNVPFPNEHFDAIVCTEVMEHLDDPLAAARSFHRMLKSGGRLVVSVPKDMGPDYCDEHVQDFTADSLRTCLTAGGFEVQSIERVVREPDRCPAESFLACATKRDLRHDYSAEYYTNRSNHPMWRVEAKAIRKLLGGAANGMLLDLGCGCGDLLTELAPGHGLGVDANPTAIDLANQRHPQHSFHCGDATVLDVPEASVDGMVSMHLIEHLVDPDEALAAWRRLLKDGGRIVLTTPNRQFPHPEVFTDPDHKRIFTGPELIELFAGGGFRVERAMTLGTWGVRRWPLVWRLQGLFHRLRLRRGLWRWWGQSLCICAVKEGRS